MPNFSGSFSARAHSQTTISLPDVPNHEINVAEISGLQKTADDNWNNAKITYWATADLVEGNGAQRGYFVDEHTDGNRDFGTFEGKVVTANGQTSIEGTWKYRGGTGKFNNLTGGGTYKGRLTSPVDVENTWEGTYQLAEKTRAA
jgi:hypothetical protein